MKVFGLTGGVGMGKSTAAKWLSEHGVPVVDADLLARQIVEPGQPALEKIKRDFGNDVIAPDGSLKREALAKIVFSNLGARQKLEAITHPLIRALWIEQIKEWRAAQCRLGVVVIPLLFETGAEKEFDATVCVGCAGATQQKRLEQRGWTLNQIRQRRAAQWPVDEKIRRSDFIIWSEGGLDVFAQQLKRVFLYKYNLQ